MTYPVSFLEWWLLEWLVEWSRWALFDPWIGTVVGVVAAIVAAVASKAKRIMMVPLVFLVVAFLLSSLTRAVAPGLGGDGGSRDHREKPERQQQGSTSAEEMKTVPVLPEHADLLVTFLPSPADPLKALEFACLLSFDFGGRQEPISIKASDMDEFEALLVRGLGKFRAAAGSKECTVVVKRRPYPGESVLRRIDETIRSVLVNANVKVQD